jgi:hypothetical protein
MKNRKSKIGNRNKIFQKQRFSFQNDIKTFPNGKNLSKNGKNLSIFFPIDFL